MSHLHVALHLPSRLQRKKVVGQLQKPQVNVMPEVAMEAAKKLSGLEAALAALAAVGATTGPEVQTLQDFLQKGKRAAQERPVEVQLRQSEAFVERARKLAAHDAERVQLAQELEEQSIARGRSSGTCSAVPSRVNATAEPPADGEPVTGGTRCVGARRTGVTSGATESETENFSVPRCSRIRPSDANSHSTSSTNGCRIDCRKFQGSDGIDVIVGQCRREAGRARAMCSSFRAGTVSEVHEWERLLTLWHASGLGMVVVVSGSCEWVASNAEIVGVGTVLGQRHFVSGRGSGRRPEIGISRDRH